jgi:hypothetical protein
MEVRVVLVETVVMVVMEHLLVQEVQGELPEQVVSEQSGVLNMVEDLLDII